VCSFFDRKIYLKGGKPLRAFMCGGFPPHARVGARFMEKISQAGMLNQDCVLPEEKAKRVEKAIWREVITPLNRAGNPPEADSFRRKAEEALRRFRETGRINYALEAYAARYPSETVRV